MTILEPCPSAVEHIGSAYGWMGRSPDYKASFLATLGANADFYSPFQENARRWYKKVTFVNHAIVNPPVDRNRELSGEETCAVFRDFPIRQSVG